MNDAETKKKEIQSAIKNFSTGKLYDNAIALFDVLGYRSNKRVRLTPNTAEGFAEEFDNKSKLNRAKALFDRWKTVEFLIQLTDDEIGHADQFPLAFDSMKKVDNKRIESYVVLAVELKKDSYTRTELSQATREINKLFPMPALVLFKCGEALTLAVIDRRLHKRDTSKDVLEKVTLIRDVSSVSPHRAHVEILFDLSLPQLVEKYEAHNFVELHEAWRQTLDSSELNKRFYQEMAHWYYWALGKVKFPKGAGKSEEVRNPLSLIRLLTRLIFVWFIKEKGLVPDQLFDRRKLEGVVKFGKPSETIYYKSLFLQNLFFATLNTEMGDDREWRNQPKKGGLASDYMVHNKYRYADYFVNPAQSLELFANIPFLNGGLFECLDKSEEERGWFLGATGQRITPTG